MLAAIIGKRRDPWFSGCNALTAMVLQCNSHFAPNFRIPLNQNTTDCKGQCLGKTFSGNAEEVTKQIARLTIICQRIMKQMTGYFCGYTCKRQPVGKFQLKTARKMLPKVTEKLSTMNASKQGKRTRRPPSSSAIALDAILCQISRSAAL